MAYMGKEPEKEWIDVYVFLNYLAEHLKLTQYCKSTIPQQKFKNKKHLGIRKKNSSMALKF